MEKSFSRGAASWSARGSLSSRSHTARTSGPSWIETPLAAARAEAQAIVDAMQAVLDHMLELESYNELVELLRDIVSDQAELREETLRQQRNKLRELLEE